MSDEKDFVEIEKEIRRKPGRPKGSSNLNAAYKKKQREQSKARETLWKKGILHWKLDEGQRELRDMYYNHGKRTTLPWLIARQWGKTWTVCTIILEEAIRNPGITMAYIAPKLNQAKRIMALKMRELQEDVPDSVKAEYKSLDNKWVWPNGSELYLAGTDNGNAESIRGMTLNRVFVDEFCFLSDFEYVMNSIIFPTMMSVSDPLMVLISSPPKTPDHESNVWLDEADDEGKLVVKTVYDCPRHTEEKIARIIKEQYHNDPQSTDFRREMMCERIADISSLVIPQATAEKVKEITADIEKPDYYQIVEAFDWGVMDSTAGLLAYVDFDAGKIIIEDEMELDGIHNTTADIARLIKEKENKLWGYRTDINRFCDNNLQIINDMSVSHELYMIATKKDNLHSQVEKVKQLIQHNQIVINPRCEKLLLQIQSAEWDKSRKKFKRKNGHHYDLVASLIYLVRNANIEVNPYPDGHGRPSDRSKYFLDGHSQKKVDDEFTKSIKDWFSIESIKRRN